MKFPSDLLYRFGRGLGTAELDGRDQTIEVPPGLLPTISLPGPVDTFTIPNSAVIQRETFPLGGAALKGPSVAADQVTVNTLGRGLWRIDAAIFHWADFTATITADNHAQLIIQDPEGTPLAWIRLPTIANVAQRDRLSHVVLFPRDSFLIARWQPATGAGQNMYTAVSGICSRLA